MDQPIRKRLPHTVPQWVSEDSFFFITVNCDAPGANHLCREDVGGAVLAAFAFNHERFVWHCRLALLMPDHLHGILAFPREPGMRKLMEDWKKFLARSQGISWQRDFFDHRVRNHHELMEKTSYIEMNPVRKGLCERAEDWPWFIARRIARRHNSVYEANDALPLQEPRRLGRARRFEAQGTGTRWRIRLQILQWISFEPATWSRVCGYFLSHLGWYSFLTSRPFSTHKVCICTALSGMTVWCSKSKAA